MIISKTAARMSTFREVLSRTLRLPADSTESWSTPTRPPRHFTLPTQHGDLESNRCNDTGGRVGNPLVRGVVAGKHSDPQLRENGYGPERQENCREEPRGGP